MCYVRYCLISQIKKLQKGTYMYCLMDGSNEALTNTSYWLDMVYCQQLVYGWLVVLGPRVALGTQVFYGSNVS